MSKRPQTFWGLPPRPPRTQAEIDLDRRLEEAAAQAAANVVTRDEWARAQYRAASRAGATKELIHQRYQYRDLRVMDEHVDQIFWQMVRHEMRTNATFNQQMQLIEGYYELPQHEFLERIKNRFWALMQQMTDDKKHRLFLQEIYRAWHAAMEAISPHPFEERAQRDARAERQYRQSADALREEYFWRRRENPMESLFEALDEEDE